MHDGPLLLPQVPAPFNLEAVMKAKADDPSALHVVLFQEVGQLRAQTSTPDPASLCLYRKLPSCKPVQQGTPSKENVALSHTRVRVFLLFPAPD